MGRETELIKAAKTGNNAFLERVFASCLKKGTSGLGSFRGKGANPNVQDEAGYTLLHHATLHGQRETVSLLLRCGASTTIQDSSGSCPLHLAAWKGDTETVKLLVTQGPSRANVNQQSYSDDTALHLASQYGYKDVVDFLLQRHADPLFTNIKGETPLDLAAQYGHLDTVHILISHCPEILHLSRPTFSPLHLAARNGHTLVALSLINAGISINTVCAGGSALHEAAMCGKTDTVRLLLDKGINTDLKDSSKRTALQVLEDYQADKAKEIRRMIQEKDGHLVPTDSHVLSSTSSSDVEPRESLSPEAAASGNVYEVVPSMRERLTSPESLVSEESSVSPPPPHPSSADPDPNTHTARAASKPSKNRLSKKEKRFQLQKDDGKYAELCPINPQEAKKEFGESLRLNPVGPAFSQVPGPSSGGEGGASNSERGSLVLTAHNVSRSSAPAPVAKPSGSAQQYLGSYYVLEVGNFDRLNAAAGSGVKEEGPGDEGVPPQPGAYYQLDVRNFENEPQARSDGATLTPSASLGDRDDRSRSASALSQSSYENVELTAATPTPGAGTPGDERVPQEGLPHTRQEYVNVEIKSKQDPSVYENVQLTASKRSGKPPSNARSRQAEATRPIDIPAPVSRREGGKGADGDLGVATDVRPSSYHYDNIRLQKHGQEDSPPTGPGPVRRMSSSLPVSIPAPRPLREQSPPGAAGSHSSQGSSQSYENVEQAFRNRRGNKNKLSDSTSPRRSPSPTRTTSRQSQHSQESEKDERDGEDGGGGGAGERKVRHPRPKSREHIYESVALNGGEKRKSLKQHQRTGSGSEQTAPPKLPDGFSRTAVIHEGPTQGREQSGPTKAIKEESVKLVEATGRRGETQKLIVSPNPFAGLVISASTQLEENVSAQAEQSELRTVAEVRVTSSESTGGEQRGVVSGQPDSELRVVSPETMRLRAETMWDNDRMDQEWTQIETVLKDTSGGLPASPVARQHSPSNRVPCPLSPGAEIYKWLQEERLGGYASVLESNGFDRIKFFNGSILARDDLHDIGITSEEDQLTIMAQVSLLPLPPRVRQATSVTEWLGFLELSHLQDYFKDYSLRKLSTLWDIELASVVGIELLGYRKRLQYGISELRAAHPDWEQRASRTSLQSLDSVTPMDGVSFTKDYSKIKSKASPRSSPRTSAVSMDTSSQQVPVLLKKESDVEIRPPREAQAKVGSRTDRHCRALPYESWKHPNTSLIKETVNYKTKYLGSVVVVRVHGTQSTEEACLRLRTSTENMKKVPEIILAISWKGVKFVDAHTMNVVSTHAVQDISYCSQDIEDKRVFAYITKDKSGMSYCHVFMAPSKEVADEVVMTIGQAFEIAYQKVMKARSKSPLRNATHKS